MWLVEQPVGSVGLEVAPDLVELLPAVTHDPARLADVAQIGRKLQQAELAPCYLGLRGHIVLRSRLDVASQLHPNLAGKRRGHAGLGPLGLLTGPASRPRRALPVITVSVQMSSFHVHDVDKGTRSLVDIAHQES